jgi:hypothetical protein
MAAEHLSKEELTDPMNRDIIKQCRKGGGTMSKTSTEVKARWNAANYDRLVIYVPKEDMAAYKQKCSESGKTLSDVPKEAIYKFLEANR